jgi:hypothetical protein
VKSTWHRLRALNARDRSLVIEAALLLTATWLGLKTLGYPLTRRMVARSASRLRRRIGRTRVAPERVAWAVVAVANQMPFRTTCLPRAIAGHLMLVRRGYPSDLRIGVLPRRAGDAQPLQSHAWMEYEGTVLIGALDNLADYAVLTARAEPS